MKLMTNQSISADNRAVAGEERRAQSVSTATAEIIRMIHAALRAFGVFQPEVMITADMPNSLDGNIKANIKAYVSNGCVSFGVTAPIVDGKLGITEPMIVSAFDNAVKTFNTTPAMTSGVSTEKLAIDLKKIQAARRGSLVIYSTPELPLWSMFVEADVLRDKLNHSLVASGIIAHLRGYVLADYNRIANFSVEPFGLPVVVETDVKAAIKPADAGFGDVPQTAYEVDQQIAMMNMQARSTRNNDLPTPSADDRLYAEQQRVAAMAERPIKTFVTQKLGGGSPQITAFDFSQTTLGVNGNLQGSLSAQVTFYDNDGLREIGVLAALDDRSVVIADKIEKSRLTLEAEQKRAAELKVLSEAEAKAQFEAFRKQREERFSAALQSGLAIQADSGDLGGNLFSRPPLQRIPVQRALLPLNANEPGKKIELGGYVYELFATNFNTMGCTDPKDSPFLMLVLTDDAPGTADAHSIYGGLRELVN